MYNWTRNPAPATTRIMIKNMWLSLIKAPRLTLLALIAAVFAVAHSGGALALSCTPGVSVSASGYSLGCATSQLWAILEINQAGSGGTTLDFKNGSGTYGSTAGMQVGVYGGTVKTTDISKFSGNMLVTDGIYPSDQATNTTAVNLGAGGVLQGNVGLASPYSSDKIGVSDQLLTQARADALSATTLLTSYALSHIDIAYSSGINAATTITATHGGLNVIQIGTSGSNKDINLDGVSDKLTFATGGFLNVSFLVEVTGNLKLNHGAQVVLGSGLDPSKVLFDIVYNGALTMNSNSVLRGIVLDAGGSGADSIDNGSVLYGELIGGAGITLDHASSVQNNSVFGAIVNGVTYSGCTADTDGTLICNIRTAPEPGTIALMLIGLLGIFGARMRRRGTRFATPVLA